MKNKHPSPLLGGLSPKAFMQRHWQKKPLLVRQALPGIVAPLSPAALFALAGRDDVQSRLVRQRQHGWQLRHGPLPRRALPPLSEPAWTLLVQGVDLHVAAAHAWLAPFRFIPDARVDDLMLSFATDGGGVGPHLDSYDVFLIQVEGQRRWRIGKARDKRLVEDAPLKILRHFEPRHEWLLEPGDMLYLPPHWAHEGVAVGKCLTASVGFRAPAAQLLTRELLERVADAIDADDPGALYADPAQPATTRPASIPPALQAFALKALRRAVDQPQLLAQALGESLSEPKPEVFFEATTDGSIDSGVVLDRRSRMLYDSAQVFINGESFDASGHDARMMRKLADRRRLSASELARLSSSARELMVEWRRAGWLKEAST